MERLSGNFFGPLRIETDTCLSGNMLGDVTVQPGRTLLVYGNLDGDIFLEGDARAEVTGNFNGVMRRAASGPSN